MKSAPAYRWLLPVLLLVLLAIRPALAPAREPALPEGLGSGTEPDLPAGLATGEVPSGSTASPEPALPAGLGGEPGPAGGPEAIPPLPEGLGGEQPGAPAKGSGERSLETAFTAASGPGELSGFWELRAGHRISGDAHERGTSLAEARLHLEWERGLASATLKLTTDLLYDNAADSHRLDLEEGRGWLDLREASIALPLTGFLDLKAGRQVLTWGVGDLLFINDLFPKDWNAFFLGRDVEYLKAPSDAVKLALFGDWANLDLVYTPRFDADRFIDGRRLSFFDPAAGRIVGRDSIVRPIKPDALFRDEEWAARLYRNLGAYETALYAYRGYWKSPAGVDAATGRATFPALSVYGASLRGPLWSGLVSAEFGWYDSRDDRSGDDPLVHNGELRFLLGYEHELAKDFTGGIQYYVEHMLDHDAYLRTLPAGTPPADENHHLVTLRLTLLTDRQNLEWSLFAFLSPSDRDLYLRPIVNYKASDQLTLEAGANLLGGEEDHTFFGQLRNDSNAYVSIRYGF